MVACDGAPLLGDQMASQQGTPIGDVWRVGWFNLDGRHLENAKDTMFRTTNQPSFRINKHQKSYIVILTINLSVNPVVIYIVILTINLS